uniref:Uncharacterized protein n=1 Tax=Grammatophora oceanica TaxID=210454 RepID=A0A7S1UPU7_9STRA|mmetsp:Transcript_16351/g.24210  ORF Transcript_16351/g.24210 Transcript_16351/m.24210 type:complete len:206 (+) Transcript_16351:365-982(+)
MTNYFGPVPAFIKDLNINTQIFECTEEIYHGTGNGTICNYDNETDTGDLANFLGDDHLLVVRKVPDSSPTNTLEIVSVTQDDVNIKISWKLPRTSTLSSPNMFLRYCNKPSSFDGTGYEKQVGLEYHGPSYRTQMPFALLPAPVVEDLEAASETGDDFSAPSASPTAPLSSFNETSGALSFVNVLESTIVLVLSSSFALLVALAY